MMAWLIRHPLLAIAAVGYAALLLMLGLRTHQLRSAEATVAHQVEVIASLAAAEQAGGALTCGDAVQTIRGGL